MDQNQLSPTITNHNQVSSNMLIKLLQSYLSTMTHQLSSTMEDSDLSTRRHARVSVASMMDVLVQSLSVAAPTIRNCSPKLRPAWALWEPEPWCGDILGAIFRHQSNSKNMCSSCVLKRSETFILSIYRYINYIYIYNMYEILWVCSIQCACVVEQWSSGTWQLLFNLICAHKLLTHTQQKSTKSGNQKSTLITDDHRTSQASNMLNTRWYV